MSSLPADFHKLEIQNIQIPGPGRQFTILVLGSYQSSGAHLLARDKALCHVVYFASLD